MTSPVSSVPAPCLTFELGGLPVRLFTDDPLIRSRSREGFRRWKVGAGSTAPPLDLHVSRMARLPGNGGTLRPVRYRPSDNGSPREIVCSRFRIRTDPAGLRMDAEVDATSGLGDFFRMALGAAVLSRGGILLHAAALEMPDGSVHLFCGPSGFGKTTLARLAPRKAVLADDTVAVWPADEQPLTGGGRQTADGRRQTADSRPPSASCRLPSDPGLLPSAVYASPTPFFGDYGRPPSSLRPDPRPVSRLYLLAPHAKVGRLGARKSRGIVNLFRLQTPNPKPETRNPIEAVSPGLAAAAIASQVIAPGAPPADAHRRLLDAVSALAERVPAFRLSYTPGPGVWPFLKTAQRKD